MSENHEEAPPIIEPPPPVAPPPPAAPSPSPDSQTRTWNMLCHLSALAGYFVPLGNVFGPLIVWQIKKNEIPSVDVHGKAALNFQLTVLIALLVTGAVTVVGGVLLCVGWLLAPVPIAIAIAGLIFPIIAGIKANDSKDYKYPYLIEFVK